MSLLCTDKTTMQLEHNNKSWACWMFTVILIGGPSICFDQLLQKRLANSGKFVFRWNIQFKCLFLRGRYLFNMKEKYSPCLRMTLISVTLDCCCWPYALPFLFPWFFFSFWRIIEKLWKKFPEIIASILRRKLKLIFF